MPFPRVLDLAITCTPRSAPTGMANSGVLCIAPYSGWTTARLTPNHLLSPDAAAGKLRGQRCAKPISQFAMVAARQSTLVLPAAAAAQHQRGAPGRIL